MKRRVILLIFFLLVAFTVAGCQSKSRIYVISSKEDFLLPFKASKFFGFFQKEGVELKLDYTSSEEELIRLLNFSKYTVIVTTKGTSKKIGKLSSRWRELCKVGSLKQGDRESPIVLLVKENLISRKKELIPVLKGWNYGVERLKDPAVLYYLTGKEKIEEIKFKKCQGS